MNTKVFISYSHDSDDHKQWVRSLADKLINDGIEVVLDQYDLALGDMLPHFMEKGVSESDYVLLIMTKEFAKKAINRSSGVGFEIDVATGEIIVSNNRKKFIPIYIKLDIAEAPPFIKGSLGIKIDNLFSYEKQYDELYRSITNQVIKKPKLGNIRNLNKIDFYIIEPFDLKKIGTRKNLDQWCMWDIGIELGSLNDLPLASLHTMLDNHIKKENTNGVPYIEPAILNPMYRKSTLPEMVYESNDFSSFSNASIFERLSVLPGRLRYSFVEFNSNKPFYHSAGTAEETLLLLLLILSRVHYELSREVDFTVFARIRSSNKIFYLPSFFPFMKNIKIGEMYEHETGNTEVNFSVKSLNIDSIKNFFNSIYEMFRSSNPQSDAPFLQVASHEFVGSIDKLKDKIR